MPAKPETFFIRGSVVPDDDATFVQTTIDLGSYVNVGDKKAVIMRIHGIEAEWAAGTDASGANTPNGFPFMDASSAGAAVWQLSTQTQTGLIPLTDRSCIAKDSLRSKAMKKANAKGRKKNGQLRSGYTQAMIMKEAHRLMKLEMKKK